MSDRCAPAVLPRIVEETTAARNSHVSHHRYLNTKADPDWPIVLEVYFGSRRKLIVTLIAQLVGIGFIQLWVNFLRQGSWRRSVLTLVAIAAIAVGVRSSFYPATLFLFYWVVPFATWGLFINTVRVIAEHYPQGIFRERDSVPALAWTRDVLPSWFDYLFVTTRGVNYHLTQHLFPAVPSYRLRELQRRIASTDAYRSVAHVTYGYHRALAEIVLRKR